MNEQDDKAAEQRIIERFLASQFKEVVKTGVKDALDETRIIDSETHTAHHEWLGVQIKDAAARLESRKTRQLFMSKVLAGSFVAAFTIAVGWVSHAISNFIENHFH